MKIIYYLSLVATLFYLFCAFIMQLSITNALIVAYATMILIELDELKG
jgi:hypothetical protein